MSNGSKREQIYKCGWLWQTGYYANTKRKGERGMREGWEYKKLGELVQVLNGYAFKSSMYENQGIMVLRITNVQKGNIVDDDPKYYPLSLTDEIRNYLLKESDLLMSLTGNVGRVGLLKKDMLPAALNQRVACLRILSNGLNLGFLFHYLNSDKFEQDAVRSAKGIAQKNMSTEWLKDYKLPLPPISVQQSIVSELDKINELIRLKREQLKDYDNLAQSIFYEMFGDPVENEKGWEVKKLSNNVQEMFLGPFGSALKVDSYVEKKDAFCMVYEQKHAIQGRLDLDNHFINEEKFNSLKRFEVKGGDFIMSCRGTIGKIYKLPNDAPKGIIHPSLMKIRIKEDVYDSTYFKYMLVKIVANESTNGNCVQMAITAKELGKKTLPLPPLSLQQLFAQRIELIEQQKAEIKSTIADLETLLASRMQYWFD